jgi:hypothetical protein
LLPQAALQNPSTTNQQAPTHHANHQIMHQGINQGINQGMHVTPEKGVPSWLDSLAAAPVRQSAVLPAIQDAFSLAARQNNASGLSFESNVLQGANQMAINAGVVGGNQQSLHLALSNNNLAGLSSSGHPISRHPHVHTQMPVNVGAETSNANFSGIQMSSHAQQPHHRVFLGSYNTSITPTMPSTGLPFAGHLQPAAKPSTD